MNQFTFPPMYMSACLHTHSLKMSITRFFQIWANMINTAMFIIVLILAFSLRLNVFYIFIGNLHYFCELPIHV